MLEDSYKLRKLLIFCCVLAVFVGALSGCGKKTPEIPLQQKKQEGQRLARINIRDYGSITFRLLPEEEPEVVNEFLGKAEQHMYDGTSFYNIIEDYLMIGGKEADSMTDTGTDSVKKVRAEMKGNLYPFRGALCTNLLSDGTCTLDSFYVIGLDEKALGNIEELLDHKGYTLSDYIKFGYKTEVTDDELETFRKYGGAPWLTGHTVVFGQAIEGMDVLDKIMEDHLGEEDIEAIIDSIETY